MNKSYQSDRDNIEQMKVKSFVYIFLKNSIYRGFKSGESGGQLPIVFEY